MPAISIDNVFALPRLPRPDAAAVDRPVRSVTTAPAGLEGEGFPVRRAFAGVDLRALDPFAHMDQMGKVSTPRASRRELPGTPIAASRQSPT